MDMNSCKPGDKLICRNGSFAYYLDRKGTPHFPHRVRYEDFAQCNVQEIDTVDNNGVSTYSNDGTVTSDIVSHAQSRFTKDGLLNTVDNNGVSTYSNDGTSRMNVLEVD